MGVYRRNNEPFEKSYPGFSYVLSPEEERFLKHMKEIAFLRRRGEKTDFTRAEYMRRMGLREYTFDRCAKSLCQMGLVIRTADSSRNRVHYDLNESTYDKLVWIVSQTRNTDRLIEFFDFHIFKLGKSIDSIREDEIRQLSL